MLYILGLHNITLGVSFKGHDLSGRKGGISLLGTSVSSQSLLEVLVSMSAVHCTVQS